ncbi:MAG: hypothetical protein AMXMBFR61_08680 [Fimbriimonadales bacterium]
MNSFGKGAIFGALIAVAFMSVVAFQGAAPKNGSIDLDRVVRESKIGKEAEAQFNRDTRLRNELLQHFDAFRCYDENQRKEVRDLWLAPTRTAEQEQRLDLLKTQGQAMQKELADLQMKAEKDRTKEESDRLRELTRRAIDMDRNYLPLLNDELRTELQNWRQKSLTDIINKVKAAVQKIGREQGFSVIFDAQYAPYTPTDISDLVLKEIDK